MCVVSMVHDHFRPLIPDWVPQLVPVPIYPLTPQPPAQPFAPFVTGPNPAQADEWRKILADFREAVKAAKKVDALTGQPDCVDPEKAKLEDRVAALEIELAKMKKRWRAKRK